MEIEHKYNETWVEDMPLDILAKNKDLDFRIQWVRFETPELFLGFDTGEAPSGCMWGPCHLPVGYWLGYGLYVYNEDLHTSFLDRVDDLNMETLLGSNRTLLFYRWMDPRDKPFDERRKNLKSVVDKINPGKDYFHSRFYGGMRPFTRYRKLNKGFRHESLARDYEKYVKELGELKIRVCYIGDVDYDLVS